MAQPEVSVVIPVLDEAANVPELCRRLRQVLDPTCDGYEVIFVDDGSSDGTDDAVLREHLLDERVKLMRLSRNFGHQQALTAGIDVARGDAVIMMDGDLHPPELLPELLRRWRDGCEIVTTTHLSVEDRGPIVRTLASWFYRALSRLSGLDLKDGSADFRLMDRVAVNALRGLPERSRFLRGMVQWIGFRQGHVEYHAPSRKLGQRKYTFRRLARLALLATVSFSTTPLSVVAVVGFVLAGLSFLYGAYSIVARLLFGVPVVGWASILTTLTFIGGVQLISLGVIGAYVAQIYEETKARPIYVVRRAVGFANDGERLLVQLAATDSIDTSEDAASVRPDGNGMGWSVSGAARLRDAGGAQDP